MTNQTPDDALEAAMKMATKWEDAVHLVNDRGYNPATEVRAFRELEAAIRHAQAVAARYAYERGLHKGRKEGHDFVAAQLRDYAFDMTAKAQQSERASAEYASAALAEAQEQTQP